MPTESHVTAKNVFLYNRQLNAKEIRTLFLSQDLDGVEEDKDSSDDGEDKDSSDDGDDNDGAHSNSSSSFGGDASSVSAGGRNLVYVSALVLHLLVLVYF
ncbi:trans-sialidase [Trypanosoma cruzi]|nr:trans-sialidase [Trypanosoma cruzi]